MDGSYLWNTGAFIFKAGTMLKLLKKLAPRIYCSVAHDKNICASHKRAPDISIDYAVMEKAHNIYCAKGAYGWNDIGSFESLIPVLRRESRRFVLEDGKVTKIL